MFELQAAGLTWCDPSHILSYEVKAPSVDITKHLLLSHTTFPAPTLRRPPLRESEMRNTTLSLKHSQYTYIDILHIIKQLPINVICLSWKASPWREARMMPSILSGQGREAALSAGCCWRGKYLHFLRLVTAESPHSSLSSPPRAVWSGSRVLLHENSTRSVELRTIFFTLSSSISSSLQYSTPPR